MPRPEHGPVRVLHVHSGNMFGGVEWFLRTLVRYGGHAPWMTTDFALCFDEKIARDLRGLAARVHILGSARLRSPLRMGAARKVLARVLEAGGYDIAVCHSAWSHAIFAPVIRKQGARLVHFTHDVPNPLGWVERLAGRTTPDVVFCNTRFMENSGRWWFREVPRKMVRYPVPIGQPVGASARAALRASLGTGANDIVILHASRMQAWKGHRVLIKALADLRANPRWTCWLAGGAQRPIEVRYENELHAEVKKLGLAHRFRFLGQRDDVPAIMQASDVYCQPNISPEPFGVAVLEALAAGLPIVTAAMGGPLEVVNPSCGFLVGPGERAVSTALALLVDDDEKRATLSRGAPVRARELCDVETRIRELAIEFSRLK